MEETALYGVVYCNEDTMDRLLAGQALQAGNVLESPNGWMRLILQNDGDVVLRRAQMNEGVSVSHSAGDPVAQLTMQTDGDLVASGATGIRHWHSGTDGNTGAYAVLQDDGLFVIYDGSGSLLQDYGTVIDWNLPTISYRDDRNYSYVETSERWKQQCEQLPCFDALKWPGYDSIHVDMMINGQPGVIQLWHGWCQKFLALQTMPGGFGAEVGVYRRIPGHVRPTSFPFLPPQWEQMVLQALKVLPDRDLWWPAPEVNAELEFTITNPANNQILFDAGPQTSYWLTKWMDELSYIEYLGGRSRLDEIVPDRYSLKYTVNGQVGEWLVPTWKPLLTVRDSIAELARSARRRVPNILSRWRR
jgi:hypothetical protein